MLSSNINILTEIKGNNKVMQCLTSQMLTRYARKEIGDDWGMVSKMLNTKHPSVQGGISAPTDVDVYSLKPIIYSDRAARSILGALWTYGFQTFYLVPKENNNNINVYGQLTKVVRELMATALTKFEWALQSAITNWIEYGNALVIYNQTTSGIEFHVPHPLDVYFGYSDPFSTDIGTVIIKRVQHDLVKNRYSNIYKLFLRDENKVTWTSIVSDRKGEILAEDSESKSNVFIARNIILDGSPYGVGWGQQAVHALKQINAERFSLSVSTEKALNPKMGVLNAQTVTKGGDRDIIDMSSPDYLSINATGHSSGTPPLFPLHIPRITPEMLHVHEMLDIDIKEIYRLSILDLQPADKTMSADESMKRANASQQLYRTISGTFYRDVISPMIMAVVRFFENDPKILNSIQIKYQSIADNLTNSKDLTSINQALSISSSFIQLDPTTTMMYKSDAIQRKVWGDLHLSDNLLLTEEELNVKRIELQQQQQAQQQAEQQAQQ